MKTALIIIATGPVYWDYAADLMRSAARFFVPHNTVLFTDCPNDLNADMEYIIPAAGFPEATLMRYHTILKAENLLRSFDFCYFCDSDMRFVSPIEESEIFSDGITATEHPGYVGRLGPSETNPKSASFCPQVKPYFCGGFDGGKTEAYIEMAKAIKASIDEDAKNGIVPIWHDESSKNKYLQDHPPAKILDPSFCYPQGEYENPGGYYRQLWTKAGRTGIIPKLVALEKRGRR